MQEGDEEYCRLRNQFMREEAKKSPQTPTSMRGSQGWFAVKEREFKEKLKREGLLK